MMYLDSSVLIKRYIAEKGSDQVAECFAGGEVIHTSSLSYAEILAAFGRRRREGLLSHAEAAAIEDRFQEDWSKNLHEIYLDKRILAILPELFRAHPLRGSDGVHLGSALWLQGVARAAGDRFAFGVSDERLCQVAAIRSIPVWNPETRSG